MRTLVGAASGLFQYLVVMWAYGIMSAPQLQKSAMLAEADHKKDGESTSPTDLQWLARI